MITNSPQTARLVESGPTDSRPDAVAFALSARQTYHELRDPAVVEVDVLKQLKANVAQLEDLHGRLRFMMSELQCLLKRG